MEKEELSERIIYLVLAEVARRRKCEVGRINRNSCGHETRRLCSITLKECGVPIATIAGTLAVNKSLIYSDIRFASKKPELVNESKRVQKVVDEAIAQESEKSPNEAVPQTLSKSSASFETLRTQIEKEFLPISVEDIAMYLKLLEQQDIGRVTKVFPVSEDEVVFGIGRVQARIIVDPTFAKHIENLKLSITAQ